MRKLGRGPDPRKRADKAARRKATLAARGGPSVASRSSLNRARSVASTFGVDSCMVSESLFDVGMGYVVLGRTISPTKVAMAAFMLDVYCLGAKNGFFVEVDRENFDTLVEGMAEAAGPFVDSDPACARKLVEGVVDYAQRLGFAPHEDYPPAHALFGDIDTGSCPTAYAFGMDGKPCYIVGPHDTPARIRKILRTLTDKVGEDNFDYILPAVNDF
jgi:hypothetical protein